MCLVRSSNKALVFTKYSVIYFNMSYSPMPVEFHLARGYCCEAEPQCKLCPYQGARQAKKNMPKRRPQKAVNPELSLLMARAFKGEKVEYHSNLKSSLKSEVWLCDNNLRIIYQ